MHFSASPTSGACACVQTESAAQTAAQTVALKHACQYLAFLLCIVATAKHLLDLRSAIFATQLALHWLYLQHFLCAALFRWAPRQRCRAG